MFKMLKTFLQYLKQTDSICTYSNSIMKYLWSNHCDVVNL